MQPTLNIAIRAARRAGDLIARSMDKRDALKVSTKQTNDFVTDLDRRAEEQIIATIRESYPDHAFLAEESGRSGDSDYEWIIDPLDGTTNFLHGFPVFAVSIALRVKGRLEVGVIYDPMRQELFTGLRGSGATLDDRKIRVTGIKELEGSLIGTGFPFRNMDCLDDYMDMFRAMVTRTAGLRRPGAASLDLAYVAAGRLDGFFELGLKPWDMAAGALIIQESGGLVGTPDGGTNYLDSGNIAAANPKLFSAMVKVLKPFMKKGA